MFSFLTCFLSSTSRKKDRDENRRESQLVGATVRARHTGLKFEIASIETRDETVRRTCCSYVLVVYLSHPFVNIFSASSVAAWSQHFVEI